MNKATIMEKWVFPLYGIKIPKSVRRSIEFNKDGERLYKKPVEKWLEQEKERLTDKVKEDLGIDESNINVSFWIGKYGEREEVGLEIAIKISLVPTIFERLKDILREEPASGILESESQIIIKADRHFGFKGIRIEGDEAKIEV